jgi:hypothetical protein
MFVFISRWTSGKQPCQRLSPSIVLADFKVLSTTGKQPPRAVVTVRIFSSVGIFEVQQSPVILIIIKEALFRFACSILIIDTNENDNH